MRTNRQIQVLTKKLEKLEQDRAAAVQAVRAELQEAYNRVFKRDKALAKAIDELELSNKYAREGHDIIRWIDFDLKPYSDCQEFLSEYLSETACVYADFQNDALMAHEGGCIVINDDGDVLDTDSGKWIISRNEYESVNERNRLIEAWMERTGYFPGVFREDRHGNVFHVNTQKRKSA